MKLFTTIISLIFLFSGCSGSDESNDTTKTMEELAESSTVEERPDVKSIAREALRKHEPILTAGQSDADLDEMAEATCAAWDRGASPEDMVIAAMSENLEGETGSVMMFSAMAYCPEHKLMLDAFMETYSS